jgi:hypothetical protein
MDIWGPETLDEEEGEGFQESGTADIIPGTKIRYKLKLNMDRGVCTVE